MQETALVSELRRFTDLQKRLLAGWLSLCTTSNDLRFLSDFPKELAFTCDGARWLARRHGAGVRFESGGVLLDVESEVTHVERFNANRFYDYLHSRNALELLCAESSVDRRALLYDLFERWHSSGVIERHDADVGSEKFSLARPA